MQQKKNTGVGVMNKSGYNLLRALLITFGLVHLGGVTWYFESLGTVVFVCGLITCIVAFILGIADFQKTTSIARDSFFAVLALIGIAASVGLFVERVKLWGSIVGGIKHLIPLILFVLVLKVIYKSQRESAS
ncbi:MAG: hypothetical protein Kow0089_24380 [Desulfobulbaceae bacterium]